MQRGRRSDFLLAGLGLVAIANGLMLGLALYGLLRLAVELFGGEPPWWGYGWLAGFLAGAALLALSLQRERVLRETALGPRWELEGEPGEGSEDLLVSRFRSLVAKSSLSHAPSLWSIESPEANAFAAGRNRDDASVVVTTGLLRLLEPEEVDAVLAHEIAHVESEDIKAVGRADAVADSIDELSQAKGRFFWGPRAILADMWPFLVVFLAGFVLIDLMQRPNENLGIGFLLVVLGVAWMVALWRAVKHSWMGLGQLFLFTSFLGPLSLIEWALAPPTAFLLSRLVSRARVHEADQRSVELLGDAEALLSALRKLEVVERSQPGEELSGRRFSLFVCSRPQSGYRAWLAHLYATHPGIASRIETIEGTGSAAA